MELRNELVDFCRDQNELLRGLTYQLSNLRGDLRSYRRCEHRAHRTLIALLCGLGLANAALLALLAAVLLGWLHPQSENVVPGPGTQDTRQTADA